MAPNASAQTTNVMPKYLSASREKWRPIPEGPAATGLAAAGLGADCSTAANSAVLAMRVAAGAVRKKAFAKPSDSPDPASYKAM